MRVEITETRWVEVKAAARKRIAKCEAEKLCFACAKPLGDSPVRRHCHEACYRATLRAIAAGLTTDAECVAEGYLAERGAGRPPSNPVTVRLRA